MASLFEFTKFEMKRTIFRLLIEKRRYNIQTSHQEKGTIYLSEPKPQKDIDIDMITRRSIYGKSAAFLLWYSSGALRRILKLFYQH